MEQQGILTADALIKWKKNAGFLTVPILPKHVIICPQHVMPTKYQSLWLKKITGIMGTHICINKTKGVYLSTGWGVGGAALVAICEEFYALGVRKFTLIGMAGRLTTSVSEGDVVYATSALREEGTSHHYLPANEPNIIDCPSINHVKKFNALGFHQSRFVSTDAPFRETSAKLNYWTSANCAMVDMETASLYAFAKYYNIDAVSIGIGADSLLNNQWHMAHDYPQLKVIIRKTVYQLVNL